MRAAPPVDPSLIHQPQVGFVYQRRGLKGMAVVLIAHVVAGQRPEFVVEQGKQSLFRSFLARIQVCKEMGYIFVGLQNKTSDKTAGRKAGLFIS